MTRRMKIMGLAVLGAVAVFVAVDQWHVRELTRGWHNDARAAAAAKGAAIICLPSPLVDKYYWG